jgi:hypothetical protein
MVPTSRIQRSPAKSPNWQRRLRLANHFLSKCFGTRSILVLSGGSISQLTGVRSIVLGRAHDNTPNHKVAGAASVERSNMATATISIEVDADVARVFSTASDEERGKLQLLLNLRLRELTAGSVRPLKEIMDDIGARAESSGLTPAILESLLHGD